MAAPLGTPRWALTIRWPTAEVLVRVAAIALAATATAWSLALALRLPRIVEALRWDSDAVAPMVLARSLAATGRHGAHVVLGDMPYFTVLAFDWGTAGLPGHRILWQAAPYALSLLGLGLLVWAAWRVAGRWAALVVAALGLCVSRDMLLTEVAQAYHGTTWFSTILLLAWLVALARRRRGLLLTASGMAVAVLVGANLASDPLLLVCGIVPFVGAPALLWARERSAAARSVALRAAGVAALAGALALAITVTMTSAHVTGRRVDRGSGYFGLASMTDAGRHLRILATSTVGIFGSGHLASLDRGTPLRWALLAVPVVGLALVVLLGWRALRATATPAPRRLYLLFWALGAGLLSAAFVLSRIPNPLAGGAALDRYLVPLALAVAAVVPVWASRSTRRRLGVSVAALITCATATASLVRADLARGLETRQLARHGDAVAAWLRTKGAARGYAGYWTAEAFTFREGIPTAPVIECPTGSGDALCPLRLNARSDWYRPERGIRTFVLLDPTFGAKDRVARVPAANRLGRPAAVGRFGALRALVYPFDVAARLRGAWSTHPDPPRASSPR